MKTILPVVSPAFLAIALTAGAFFSLPNNAQAQCSGLGSISLNVVAAPVPTITGNPQFCPGGNTTLTVPGSFDTYNWSNGGNGPGITVSTPGAYTVTVTNSAGCTGTAAQAVTQSPAPTPNITAAPYQCNGQFTLDAGAGFSAYAWSNGGSSQTTTFSTPGVFTVTVTNAAGCTGTDDFTVAIPPPPSVDISGNFSFCDGASTVLSATPGFAQYAWTGGSSGPNLTVSAPGTYNVTATDAFGCTDVATAVVEELPFTPPTVSGGGILCPGATLTLSADGPNYTGYNWSNGQTSQTFNVNVAGVYTVTVTAANGCTGTASANVIPGSSTTTSVIGNTIICNGSSTTLIATGSFQSYNWSNGASGSIITVNQTGPYSVTVTTNQGCTGTATATVTEGVPPNVSISGPTEFCPGSSISITAQPGGLSYLWSTGSGGQSISVNQAGTYSLIATDANGCSNTAATTITAASAPAPVISGPAEICSGNFGTLSVAGNFPAYNWSGGQNTPNITVSNAGTYTVTVTGSNGCTGTDNFNLTVNPNPVPNITAAPYACNGQLTLNAGAGFASYAWSNGGNGQTTTLSNSGNYSVTVTNTNGCTGTDSFVADIPAAPVVSVSGDNPICQGETATLTATPGFAAYVWSNSTFNNAIQVTQAGTYAVTVSDNFGCTATDAFALSVLPNPNPVISGPSAICAGGSATFSVANGFAAYNWSNGGTGPSITVSVPGTYRVTVTANNGCTGTDDATLTISNSLQPQIAEQPYQCDGQITLDAGAGFTNYAWSNGQNGQTITVSTSDNYTVTVTDATGCTGTDVVAVAIPTAPSVDITGDTQICPGETTALSATPGYAYLWSNGANSTTINVNAAGAYAVTATDAFGCTATDAITVSALAAPTVSISGPATICTGNTATFDAGSFAGYLWSTGETTQTITTAAAGNYSVVVTAANGCTATDDVNLTVATALTPQIAEQPYQCDGQITLNAGAGFTTYAWSNGGNGQTAIANSSGDYFVTVTDATGCTGMAVTAVVIPPAPQVSISGNTVFCENSNTALEAAAGFANYLWSNGETTATITVNAGGNFTVTATDAFGCTDTESISVTAQTLPAPAISGPAAVCDGATATLSVSGNFAQIIWSTGANGASITVNVSGAYLVTVTDALGCTGTDSAQLAVNPNPVAQITEQPYLCNGQITLDAGAGFAVYNWNNGESSPTVDAVSSGNYALTVTDANGCTGTAEQAVDVPALPQVTIAGDPGFCQGDSTSLTAGAGFVSYQWSTGETTQVIVVNASDNFAVTVTDALGCTAADSVQATAFANPAPVIAGPAAVCPTSTATLSVPGDFASYQWNIPGVSGNSVTVQPPVVVEVTVTDNNGCNGTASASVAVSNQLSPNIVALPYDCDGQITLDAGAGFASYLWSNAGNTQTISISSSGNYDVTVSDGGGCTGTATIQVDVPVVPQVFISGPSSFCQGESVVISATPGFAGYLWSTGDTTPEISVDDSNAYSVTVTDALGCSASTATAVTGIVGPAPVINGPVTLCEGAVATFLLDDTYAGYQWPDGSTSPTWSVDAPGDYAVTVTDAAGCTGVAGISLAGSANPAPVITVQPYGCDGLLTLDAGGGFSAYSWSNAGSNPTTNVNSSGNYSVTVTNGAGCTGTATVAANVPPPPSVGITGDTFLCPAETSTLTATPGLATYAWSDGQNAPAISIGTAGTFSVTATDVLGCTATAVITVNAGQADTTLIQTTTCDPLSAGTSVLTLSNSAGCDSVVITQTTLSAAFAASAAAVSNYNGFAVSCAGANDGAAAATPLAGQAPFSFQWSNGATSSSLQNLGAGAYTVTITDASGCSGTASVILNEPLPLTPSLRVEDLTCQSAGAISVESISGGFGPYTVRLAQEIGVTNGQQPLEFDVLDAGTFTLEITDANGCTAEQTVVLLPPVAIQEFVRDTIEIQKGDTITLNPAITITPLNIDWTSSGGLLSCYDCLTTSLAPVVATTVQLDVQGYGECQANALYLILVAGKPEVYIPNAIAPESANNFSFTIYGDERVVRVRSLQIYDRWGGQMALLRDFAPNDPAQGWNGRWKGQAVQPGVYVYWAEVEFADGSTEVFSGDVTVVK